MKKIKLCIPPYKHYNIFMPPLGLGVVSQKLLEKNIKHDLDDLFVKLHYAQKYKKIDLEELEKDDTEWIDYILNGKNEKIERIIEKIANLGNLQKYDILIFSGQFSPLKKIDNSIIIGALCKYLKKINKNLVIFCNNNYLIKNTNKKFTRINLFDDIIISIDKLIDKLKKIANLTIKNQKQPLPNFDGLPLELYKYKGIKLGNYQFFDGCPHNCFFCNDHERFSKLPNIDKKLDEFLEFNKKYNFKHFMFMNCTINPTKEFAKNIAKGIIKRKMGILWYDCANFKNMDIKTLDLLKKSGCIKLVFGFETASKKLQKYINKEIDLKHAKQIIKHAYKIGIWIDITLLCGLPYEDDEDILKTLLFIKKNYIYLRGLNLNQFVLKQGSEFFKNCLKYDIEIIKQKISDEIAYNEKSRLNWEDKEKKKKETYSDFCESVDPEKCFCKKPVQHVFRIFSNNVPINTINNYLNKKVFNNDTTKLDCLIKKYQKKIKK